jgi:hypothetical protein
LMMLMLGVDEVDVIVNSLSRASEFGCEFGWPRIRGRCLGGLAPTQITSKIAQLSTKCKS